MREGAGLPELHRNSISRQTGKVAYFDARKVPGSQTFFIFFVCVDAPSHKRFSTGAKNKLAFPCRRSTVEVELKLRSMLS